jgi:hypothetical protein
MKKVIGYILALVGLIGLAGAIFTPVREKVLSVLPEEIGGAVGTSLLVISLVLLGAGIVMIYLEGGFSSSKQKQKEVPIYKGKEIVGYRVG